MKQHLQQLFRACDDVQLEEIIFGINGDRPVLFVYSNGLCDKDQINKVIIPELQEILEDTKPLTSTSVMEGWHNIALKLKPDRDRLEALIFEGQLLIWIDHIQSLYALNISKLPQRSPDEANTEITIRGPKDAFIEVLSVNVALIRKRMRSTSLKFEQFIIGKRSQTKVGLLYIEDVIRPEILQEVKRRLSTIDIEAIFNSNQLEELMTESAYNLLPLFQYTGRPDFALDALLRGRFVILMDGNPTAIIGPINLLLLLKTAEDSEMYFLYNSFERILRLAGMWVSCFLPGFWVAILAFHVDQLPLILTADISKVRQGVPFPIPAEALIMVLLFELFREAGVRLPMAIGQILAVVGGLIIGDAAIRAGLTSPSMVVIVATSAVATFTLVNQNLQGVASVLRVFVLLSSSIFGLFGFFISGFTILLYVCNLRSFGLPFMSPLSPMQLRDMIYAILRPSWRKQKQRPNILQSKDANRQGGSS